MTKIKICGLVRPADIAIVNEVLPDYIGFVFAKSKRQISDKLAEELKAMLHRSISSVGVFVNEDLKRIIYLCNKKIIDFVQLHGDEDEDYIVKLRTKIGIPIIKAVRVRSVEDIHRADRIDSEYLLLDAFKEDQYGGSGASFDWSMITKVKKPYFLAGGINSDNVLSAIKQVNPYVIDVSSGVETDGFKDKNKIIDMITKVRSVK